MKEKHIWIPWISLWLLLFGMHYGICSAVGSQMHIEGLILLYGVVAAVLVFVALMLRGRGVVAAVLLSGAGLAVFVFFHWQRLWEETGALAYSAYRIYYRYANRYLFNLKGGFFGEDLSRFDAAYEDAGLDMDLLILLGCLVLAFYIAIVAFRFHSKHYGMLPVYALFCVCLLLGALPNQASMILLFVGTAMAMAWISQTDFGTSSYKGGGRQKVSLGGVSVFGLAAVCLCIAVVAAWQCTERYAGDMLEHAGYYQDKQHQMEGVIQKKIGDIGQFLRGSFGIDGGGKLTNSAPYFTGKEVMEVTVDQLPSNDVYLRGFTGGHYQNGSWSELSVEGLRDISKNEAEDRDLWSIPFDLLRSGEIQGLAGIDVREEIPSQMEIRYTRFGRRSRYAFLPYYAGVNAMGSDQDTFSIEEDRTAKRNRDQYTVPFFSLRPSEETAYGECMEEMGEFSGSLASKYYLRATEAYCPYDNMLEGYDLLAQRMEISEESLSYYLEAVRQVLWSNAQYSTDLDAVPFDIDYAEYFLFVEHQGYCEHFATAGTLLLQALGVPARYVSGYRIPVDRFEKGKDGKYTASVLDSDAHAWAEVLAQGWGWIPGEMTPGVGTSAALNQDPGVSAQTPMDSLQGSPANTSTPQESREPLEEPQETEAPQASEPPTETADVGEDQDGVVKSEKFGGALGREEISLLIKICVPILIVVTFFLQKRLRYRRRRLRLRHVSMSEGRGSEYIGLRIAYLLDFLRESGLPLKRDMPEVQWIEQASRACAEGLPEDTAAELLRIARKSAFAKEIVSRDEQQYFDDACRRIEQTRWRAIRGLRKIYFRLIFKKE